MKASVVIPVYNSEDTIADCLKSVLAQKVRGGFEVIVVDDGSTDSTGKITKKFPVKYIRQDNAGPATARNKGVKRASGKYVAFIDADCVASGGWLAELLKPLEENEATGVQGAYRSEQREIIARFSQVEIEDRYERMMRAKSIDWVGSYSSAYRRDVFVRESGYDEDFPTASGEDPELSFKLAKKGHKLLFNPRAVVFHKHQSTLASYLKSKFYRAYWRVLLYKKHREKAVKDSYTPQVLKVQIGLFYLFCAGIVAALLNPALSFVPVGILLAGFLSTLPFTIFALQRDFTVGLVAPFVIMLRSVVFGAGLATATVRGVARK
ncbi:MAG: glycosyltransferase [Candidatus Diapherotrites archaeon]|nr:glycosyltransferase [Candidatus Micrarchaeota archaeon]MBU1939558.1 glycosyltransferase [Candidatus Micrarchaeota archaeon]